MRQSTEVHAAWFSSVDTRSCVSLPEFMLHFTNFSVKVNLRSTEAVWTSSHGFLREGEPRILCWITRYSLSLQILIQSNLRSLFWVEMLVSKVALLILCAIVVRMRATPEPASTNVGTDGQFIARELSRLLLPCSKDAFATHSGACCCVCAPGTHSHRTACRFRYGSHSGYES